MRRRSARLAAGVLIAAGASLVALSTRHAPYRDEQEFERQIMALPYESGSSEAYWRIRDAALTPKYALFDWGLTALAAAALVLVFVELGSRAFGRRHGTVWAMANVAALATTGGYVGSLMLGASRDEFPPWADSLGIPLAGAPVLLVASLIFANVLTLPVRWRWSGAPLAAVLWRGAGWWRRPLPWLVRAACVVLLVDLALDAARGSFGSVLTGGLWLYVAALVLANLNVAAEHPRAGPAARGYPLRPAAR